MDFSNSVVSLGIIILLVVLFAIVFLVFVRINNKFDLSDKLKLGMSGKTTKKMDEGEEDKKCEICLGKIDEDSVAVCTCGKIFHDACAKPTGSCPYCGAAYETMEVRDPVRSRCPVCGRFVKGSICACGAVLPRSDNTFLCKCGNRVDAAKPFCRKCGAVYESVTMQVYKEQEKK